MCCLMTTCEQLVPACRLDGHKTSSSHLSWMFYLQGTIQEIQWGQLKKCMLYFCSHCSVSHACAASTCQLLIPACRLDGNEIYVTWICSYTLSLDVVQFLHGMITSFVVRWSERPPTINSSEHSQLSLYRINYNSSDVYMWTWRNWSHWGLYDVVSLGFCTTDSSDFLWWHWKMITGACDKL